jgi:hypothetical protein
MAFLRKPVGFSDFATAEQLRDLLADRGRHCEGERMDWQDAKDAMGWAPLSTRFRLMLVEPTRFTTRVLPVPRFKRWPIIAGFNDRHEGEGVACGIVDGFHRCAVANFRGYPLIWGYVPVKASNEPFTFTAWLQENP